MSTCELRRLHTVTYENGLAMQERLVALRQKGEVPDQLLLLEHPPVITLGRSGKLANLLVDEEELRRQGIRFHETTRGGDITYHGPGQLVGYPLLHLGEGRRDIRKYVTSVEEVLIRVAAEYGIEAGRIEGQRGVWVGRDKLAALGVRIARWTTSHGFALNVSTRLDHFRTITPCGLPGTGVTSLERLTGRSIPMEEVVSVVIRHFSEVFERELIPREHDVRIVKVVLRHEGRYLLLHRAIHDFWQPVTGTMEPGESPEDAAKREVWEETGQRIELEPLHLRQSFVIDADYVDSRKPLFADETAFLAEAPAPLVQLSAEEHDAYEWLSMDEALARIRWSDDREAIEAAERLRSIASQPGAGKGST
jgi:lipoyl(octanoyl) transferase